MDYRCWTTGEVRTCMGLKERGLTYGQIAMALRRSRGAVARQISDTIARQVFDWNTVKRVVKLG